MTLHTKRREPGNGARYQRNGSKERTRVYHTKSGETVSITIRMDAPDFAPLKAIAERRGVPVASVVREACRDFVLRGPVYEPTAS